MARAAKSALVLCMDVGFSMSNSEPGQEPPFEQARKVIRKFVQRQVFDENKDEVGLVLFGTDETKNRLAKDGQYQNITVRRHLMIPDFELLEEIQNELQPGGQQADWLDALVVCMDLLQQETMGKKCNRLNVVMLTDLHVQTSEDQLDVIIENLKKAGITLQFFLPFPLNEDGGDEGGSGSGSAALPPRPGKGLSREQTQGLEMVRNIMTALDEEDGLQEVYTFSDALEKLSIFKCIARRPMAWPCQLTIGTSLTIRIVGYKAVTEEKVKKTWAVVDAESHQKDDVKRETVYCRNDDEETEVQKDDTIQGYRYGSDIVPFSKVDEDQMKYKHDGKSFAVLGFTKQELIPRHQFMGSQVVKVFAPRDDEHAAVALSALIGALDGLKMAAIVRYAYDRRSNPQVGAAFPCIKEKYECLLYVQLPFMEDLRQFTFPMLENNKKFTASESQLSAVDALIDSMMLVEKDEDGETVDIFKPNHLPNPQFQRLYQCLHHRGVNPDDPLPAIEPWLQRVLEPPQAVSARCQAPLRDVRTEFPLKEVVKKKEVKTSADVFGSSAGEPDAKRVKVSEETEFNLADITEGSVTSVGSVNPARDFQKLIRQKSVPFHQACQQLIGRTEQLLGNRSAEYYMKSITCIQGFREQSVKCGNAELFNSHMQSLKRSVPDRNLQEFWDLLVQDALTLISSDEVDSSTISKQDAKQFLELEQKADAEAASAKDDTGDVDDLLDMM
ncbi:X-ray repair cross-complementing protein 5 [Triplophysa rosa]|uniref:X-ray repair cross-complementing protein 5 n=1 Tax=Triplophysa rosa TaxID=992332 RepID=A0A9W8C6Q1_TRIRA|nr:X-ray repair cross-complementing protein 5 [Triplophysa rosa]KAI7808737.1 Xrcc5 protein [Triplophysa rosa]